MTTEKSTPKNIVGKPFTYSELVAYQEGTVVSRTLVDSSVGTVTVFAFDNGQRLSTHSAPFDALLQIVEGTGVVTIEETEHILPCPSAIIMPANLPHSVEAREQFKMVLTMIRAK